MSQPLAPRNRALPDYCPKRTVPLSATAPPLLPPPARDALRRWLDAWLRILLVCAGALATAFRALFRRRGA